MPWALIKGSLQRLRVAQALDRAQAARRTGLRDHTIRTHEGPKAPRLLRDDTVKRYAAAYKCEAEAFVKWEDHAARVVPSDHAEPVLDPIAPPSGTLERRAQRERELGGGAQVTTPSGSYELLGAALLRRCFSACQVHKDQRVAIVGRISDQDYVPEFAAKVLGAAVGAGAIFKIERKIAKGLPVYATVFTRTVEHTRYLMDRADAQKRATVIARVFVKVPDEHWKGFFIFEKPKRPRPFAFVVEEVVEE